VNGRQHIPATPGRCKSASLWATGSGETIVAIIDAARVPTRAHALLANTRHVIVFTVSADDTPREAARQIGAAVADLGIVRFDLLGEGGGRVVADTRTSSGDRFSCACNPCWRPG
jgi:hypothetical protein